MDKNRARRIALVTGASRRQGIGAAICRALAADGIAVYFTFWSPYDKEMPWGADEDGPRLLGEELTKYGVRWGSLAIDLSLPESPARLFTTMAQQGFGGSETGESAELDYYLEILVNNATYSTTQGYAELDATTLDAHYAVNMRGTMLLSTEFARRFRGTEGGRIINLSSGQSLGPMPEELAYVATKGAIEAFTVSLAAALAVKGITVNAVNPGPTDTGWLTPEAKRELLPRFPQGRLGQPLDIARLVRFLASEEASWITGQIIHSEGGFRR